MSATNVGARSARLTAARRLLRPSGRRAAGRFLAEGRQAVDAGLTAGALVELYVGEGSRVRHADLLARATSDGVPVSVASDAAVAGLSETVTPQGLVAVARLPQADLAQVVGAQVVGRQAVDQAAPLLFVLLVEARDPGNAGTVIRTADAAGAAGVILTGASVDPFGGKSVRASAGSVFHLPVVTGVPLDEAAGALRRAGCRLVAAVGDAERDLDAALDAGELAGPVAWMFGNEAHGLPRQALHASETSLAVPVYGRAESLNLAAAVAICLYATVRAQRHTHSSPQA